MTVKGIDISAWQHPGDAQIDWAEVAKAGYSFVMIKSSQGQDYVNPYLREDATGAHDAGLLVGCYHYATPAAGTAELEALHAISAVSGVTMEIGLALDLEELGSLQMFEVPQWAQEWLKHVNDAGHSAPVYCNDNYLAQLTGAPWGHRLWLAFSNIEPGIKPWMHQGPATLVPGIEGEVDTDVLLVPRGVNPSLTVNQGRTAAATPEVENAPVPLPLAPETPALTATETPA